MSQVVIYRPVIERVPADVYRRQDTFDPTKPTFEVETVHATRCDTCRRLWW